MPDPLNETAARTLAALDDGLPVALRPFADLAARVGVNEAEALAALRSLKEQRVLRRLGARFSLSGLGYEATLGAFAISEERTEDAAAALGALPNVTHVFEIEDRYRLWFTLVVPSQTRLEIAESEIARAIGATDRYRVLPAELFKVTASFDVEGAPEESRGAAEAAPVHLDRDEKALVRLLQGELPLTERPFAALAEMLSSCGYDVDERWALDRVRSLMASGALTRIVATVRTCGEPSRGALAVWACPSDPNAAGALIASFPEVLHCFERRVPGIGTSVISVIEGSSRAEVERTIARVGTAGDLDAPRVVYPLREHSRSPMRYFTDGD